MITSMSSKALYNNIKDICKMKVESNFTKPLILSFLKITFYTLTGIQTDKILKE